MSFGPERLIADLKELGFDKVTVITDPGNTSYALIPGYEISAGNFAGQLVDLAIPVPLDFPRSTGAAIHLRKSPHLVDFGNVPNIRNVIPSNLGVQWQYWSYRFTISSTNATTQLMSQINGIFRKN